MCTYRCRLRNIRKKINEINELEKNVAGGATLTPEQLEVKSLALHSFIGYFCIHMSTYETYIVAYSLCCFPRLYSENQEESDATG